MEKVVVSDGQTTFVLISNAAPSVLKKNKQSSISTAYTATSNESLHLHLLNNNQSAYYYVYKHQIYYSGGQPLLHSYQEEPTTRSKISGILIYENGFPAFKPTYLQIQQIRRATEWRMMQNQKMKPSHQ